MNPFLRSARPSAIYACEKGALPLSTKLGSHSLEFLVEVMVEGPKSDKYLLQARVHAHYSQWSHVFHLSFMIAC